jgi:hypothetical protein
MPIMGAFYPMGLTRQAGKTRRCWGLVASVDDVCRRDALVELKAVTQGTGHFDPPLGVDPQRMVDAEAPGVFAPALAAR